MSPNAKIAFNFLPDFKNKSWHQVTDILTCSKIIFVVAKSLHLRFSVNKILTDGKVLTLIELGGVVGM